MDLKRFRRLLDAYGADMRSWPIAQRLPAQDLLAASADARRAHAETVVLDGRLRAGDPAVSEASVQRVLGMLAIPPQQVGTAEQYGGGRQKRARDRAWASMAVLAGMAALGLAIGLFDFDTAPAGPSDLIDTMFDTGLVRDFSW